MSATESEVREVALALADTFRPGAKGVELRKARVVNVNVGPPKSVDLLIEDKYSAPGVRYLASYANPTVDDSVYVLRYGTGQRVVLGEEA